MNENNNRSYVKREASMFFTRIFILAVLGFGLYAGYLYANSAPTDLAENPISNSVPASFSRVVVLGLGLPGIVMSVMLLRAIGRAFTFYFRIHRPMAKIEKAMFEESKPIQERFEDPAKIRARLERERRARQRERDWKYREALDLARGIPDERERIAAIKRVRSEYAKEVT